MSCHSFQTFKRDALEISRRSNTVNKLRTSEISLLKDFSPYKKGQTYPFTGRKTHFSEQITVTNGKTHLFYFNYIEVLQLPSVDHVLQGMKY